MYRYLRTYDDLWNANLLKAICSIARYSNALNILNYTTNYVDNNVI